MGYSRVFGYLRGVSHGQCHVLAGSFGFSFSFSVSFSFSFGGGTGSAFFLKGGQDYGGAPAKPVREWAREIHALARLAQGQRKQSSND